jgi:hypothetical protein
MNIDDFELNIRISEVMLRLGIYPHYRGYHLLKDIVLDYIRLGEFEGARGKIEKLREPSVEKAVRSAIKGAFNNGGLLEINEFYRKIVYFNDKQPTNLEMVAIISELVQIVYFREQKDKPKV